MPLKLGTVCSRWRNIALSTERLWCDIYVDIGAQHHCVAELLEIYLKRSGNSPLSITFQADVYKSATYYACQLIRLIVHQSPRWLRAALDVSPVHFMLFPGRPFAALAGNLPILEQLAIYPDHEATRLFKTCPRLNTLEFFPSDPCSGLDSVPWSQVVVLQIREWHQDFLPFLFHSPQLDHFTVCGAWLAYGAFAPYPRATSNIQSLSIDLTYSEGIEGMTELFAALTLPRLNSFSITYDTITYDTELLVPWDCHAAFVSLLHRSACTLQTLTLRPQIMTNIQLEEILLLVPALGSLSLHEPALDLKSTVQPFEINTLLQSLTLTSNAEPGSSTEMSTCLLPRLVHLDLAVFPNSAFDAQIFMTMLESRVVAGIPRVRSSAPPGAGSWSSDACLRQAILSVPNPEELRGRFHERLRNLRDCGLKVALRSCQ